MRHGSASTQTPWHPPQVSCFGSAARGEPCAEGLAGAEKAGFDRAAGEVEGFGDFIVAETVELAEDEDGAVIFGEQREGGVEIEAGVDLGDVGGFAFGGGGGNGAFIGEEAEGHASLAAEEGRLAEENRVEPGFDAGAFLERFHGTEGGGEGFLDDIFGVGAGRDEGAGEAQKGGGVTVDELVESVVAASSGLSEQIEVGGFQRGSWRDRSSIRAVRD